ncbi:MAG: peptidase M1, partial [Acidobacteria bacterium]|nr:peptidase M1 [Acidobacteriota bacterium]
MMKLIFVALLTMTIATVLNAQMKDPEAGVPRELARWRAAHYSNVHYKLSLKLKPGAQMLEGSEEIRVTLDKEADQIILDWRSSPPVKGDLRLREIRLNEKSVAGVREVNEHLIIPGVKRGENVIRLKFQSPIATSGSAITRYLDREDKSEYIYTLFVPSDASTAFPCFDQPDLKARFTLDLSAPQDWNVVSNTPVASSGTANPGDANIEAGT